MASTLRKNEFHVIDNFFEESFFEELEHELLGDKSGEGSRTPMQYKPGVSFDGDGDYFFTHDWYYNPGRTTKFFDLMHSLSERVAIRALLRGKINWYPKTEKVFEHEPHIDYDFPVDNILIFVNTCNGFTRMSDGTKVDSVANRAVLFRGDQFHNSSTSSNVNLRCTINVNCFLENAEEFAHVQS